MTGLPTYVFSTLYTTLPHNLINDLLILLNEPSKEKALLTLHVTTEKKQPKNIIHGLLKMYVMC